MEEMDFDLGLDDLSVASSAKATTAAATSRFAPKQKGKPIKLPAPKPEPVEIKPQIPIPTIIKKCESEPLKDHATNGEGDRLDDDPMQSDGNHDDDVNDDKIEDDDEVVIEEVNVYLTAAPLADETSLYVMQYPLRASWRPYELNERCEEVRVKPKQSRIEVDLKLDIDGENYDQDVSSLRLEKQTLSSFRGTSMPYFAVGIRIRNQLHLNPVDAIVQLRPEKICLKVGGHSRKQTALSQDANTAPLEGKSLPMDSSENLEDAEPWVPLEYQSSESYFTDSYRQKMVAKRNNEIECAMKQSDFVNFLCPGTSSSKKGTVGPSRRVLLSMPLEERLKKWLCEGPQVNRFTSLLYLAPAESIEEVLKVLQQYADLVQGLWVTKSSLLYDGFLANARDYILSQFSNSCVIRYEKQRPPPPFVRQIMVQLAVQRPALNDWKFREPTDLSFIKGYPNIVKEQEYAWAGRVKQLMASLHGVGKTKESQAMDSLVKSLNPHMLKKTVDLGNVHSSKNGIDNTVSPMEITMSNGTREDLVKALSEILQLHRVRSLNTIIKELNGRIKASKPELQSALTEIAVDIHGVYVLNSPRDQVLDPLRNFIINLFRQKKANARFREQEVRKAAQGVLKRNISDSEFKQVINELCTSKGGLALKTGDVDEK